MKTKNITVSVDEETHRLARIRAAELDTSVSALVREYLRSLAGSISPVEGETAAERRRRRIRDALADIHLNHRGFRAADTLSREELYDRQRIGTETEEDRQETAAMRTE